MNATEVQEAAKALFDAERTATPMSPLTERYERMTVEDAYAVQSAYRALREAAGARLVGRKVGATSKAIQEQFGVPSPDFGLLFDDMCFKQEEPIPGSTLIAPRVEAELAFVLAGPLQGPVTEEEVLGATAQVIPCIEVIDSRIERWQIRLEDTVADNGSSARYVLGEAWVDFRALPLAEVSMQLRRNGEPVADGTGAAVLGNPVTAVAWLARTLGELGAGFRAGDVVLSGSFAAAIPSEKGDLFEATFGDQGRVSCRFGA